MDYLKIILRLTCFCIGVLLTLSTNVKVNPNDGKPTPITDLLVIIAIYLFEGSLLILPWVLP